MSMGGTLDRRAVVAELLQDRGGLCVVTGLWSRSYDAMAVGGDHDTNYYLWAAMGQRHDGGAGPRVRAAGSAGDGADRRRRGADGFRRAGHDCAAQAENFSIVILDNGHFGETGMQPSHAGQGIELAQVAAACGFPVSETIADQAGIAPLRARIHAKQGLNLAVVKIAAVNLPRALPPRDGVHVKNRFRQALGFAPA